MSATEVGVAVGAVVVAGGSKPTVGCAVELKYELDPSNVAIIVYVPGMVFLGSGLIRIRKHPRRGFWIEMLRACLFRN
ncbi:MAG: hypothetical protein ABSA75_00020 [Candidatus Bathyarchaeia archaeon]